MDPEVNERFERIESSLVRLVEIAVSHEERLDRLTASQERLVESHQWIVESHQSLVQSHQSLVAAQAKTDEQIKLVNEELGVLIRMMDEWIRNNPRNGSGQKA